MFYLILFINLLGTVTPSKDEFSITLKLENEKVAVGKNAYLTLKAMHPPGYHLNRTNLKTNLLEYFGYGSPPFSVSKEEVVSETFTNTEIRYRLHPLIMGSYDLSFGLVTFNETGGDAVTIVSPVIPLNITLGLIDTDYVLPKPPFLLLKPLLPVEIDLELKQKLMSDPEILLKERHGWQEFFFFRKIPLYVLTGTIIFGIALLVAYAIGLRGSNKTGPHQKSVDAVLKELLFEMQAIQAEHKDGKISSETALVKMQRALINTFELRLNIPASLMTVEELKEALVQIPKIQKGSRKDLDGLLNLTLGIKFGKKTVGREQSIEMMDRSLKVLQNFV